MSQERIAFENWLGIKPCGAAHDLAWAAWRARASLPAPQQATPATPEDMKVYDGIAAGYFADAQQATPEPVGEPVARVELMQTGGNAGLATRIVEIDDPLRERLRPGDLLFTHPAPGVPEGFALVPVEPTPAMKTAGINVEVFASDPNAGPLNWEEVEAVYRAMLAAAQAKGDQP